MNTPMRLLVVIFAVLALVLAACNGEPADDVEDVDDVGEPDVDDEEVDLEIEEEGVLRVGSDIDFPPFEMIEDGDIVGFDVDLMEEIAGRLGLEVEWVDTPFDTIFTQLAAGDFDAIISAITITEERRQTIEFTDAYFEAIQSLVVQAGSDIASTDDLAGADVGAQAGTTGEDYATETFTESQIVSFPTYPAAFTALETGQVDAVLADLPAAEAQVERSDTIEIVQEIDTGENYGIGVQQDATQLRDRLNEILAEVIDDGTYEQLFIEWFDGPPPERFRAS